jgi:hypothetical protein
VTGAPRQEELFAFEVLRRVLGARFTGHDDGTAPRQVDGLFTLPDEKLGALEVTTLGDPAALEVEALTFDGDWSVPGSEWYWHVSVGQCVRVDELHFWLPYLVTTCEGVGLKSPEYARHPYRQMPAFRWARENGVLMFGQADTGLAGKVDVVTGGMGGAVTTSLDGLPSWLADELEQPRLAAKIDKLRATGRPELHLFLRVHASGLPFGLFYALTFSSDTVPADDLSAPAALTGLWLVSQWSDTVLRWNARLGWSREDCLDDP